VWAVDVNERALLLAGENAARLGVGDRVSAVLRAGRLGILDRTALAS
jgi:methylase of polypeptide subunit release factors